MRRRPKKIREDIEKSRYAKQLIEILKDVGLPEYLDSKINKNKKLERITRFR